MRKNKLHKFLSSPKDLILFFLFVNLIPSFLLVYSEPFNWAGKLILLLFPLGLLLGLFSLAKRPGTMQLILIPLLITHAFQLVLFYLFGEEVIAVDMFLNLATTNATEAGELLDNLLPAIIGVCVIYIPTILVAILAYRRKTILSAKIRGQMAIASLLIICLSFGMTFIARDSHTDSFALKQDIYPANVGYNLYFAINKWQKSDAYPKTSTDFRFNAHRATHADRREIYVLVVGEASRSENWSLFGYERETNPQLKNTSGLVAYSDAITQSNTTHKSVPIILSAASAEDFNIIYTQKSIIQAFKESGFKTVFLSNQTPNRSFTDYFAKEADVHINIRPVSSGGIYSTNNYDEELLPLCQKCIDSIPGNLFFVLHTYGSHFNYRERYPRSFAKFLPDDALNIEKKNRQQLINAYDNSIRYTDDFLKRLITLLSDSEECTALFYTSDHGEDLLDDRRGRFLHASPHPTYYQLHIPMLAWFSTSYQFNYPLQCETAANHANQPVTTNAVFHTMLDIASITTPELRTELSLVNPAFLAAPRMYLSDHDQPVLYYNAGLKKEDRNMIAKKRMNHDLT